MKFNRVLITGGAGFVGSTIAFDLKNQFPQKEIVVIDNLKRRGSELQIKRLMGQGIEFVHGDIRNQEDLENVDADVLIECSAEPSVMAGMDGSPAYLIQTNLVGTLNCLEWCRVRKAPILFLSTSRVYPMEPLSKIEFEETESRFQWLNPTIDHTRTVEGIGLGFPMDGVRSLYGATKYSAELLIREYCASYGFGGIVTRFGVLTGPWQMGKVDQGFVSLWVARHFFKGKLFYQGYGGQGKQVRDILHVSDLCSLIRKQLDVCESYRGEVFQAAGGRSCSVSLKELTSYCQEITGNQIAIESKPDTHGNDVRILTLDSSSAETEFGWKREKEVSDIVSDIYRWLDNNEELLKPIFT
jgi:CDP-paratose 2-epimerase